jgi:hypothetical protein
LIGRLEKIGNTGCLDPAGAVPNFAIKQHLHDDVPFLVTPQLHDLRFDGAILQRGFWLYIWQVTDGTGHARYYVGRTGDSSSMNAQSPFARISQHLGTGKHTSQLRGHLRRHGVEIGTSTFDLITYGPIFTEGQTMEEHRALRDRVAVLERELCDAMKAAGYDVLNTVKCRMSDDDGKDLWGDVRAAFAERLPGLKGAGSIGDGDTRSARS